MEDLGVYGEANARYKAILKLDKLLTAEGIPHELSRMCDGWRITYPSDEQREGDVVEHQYSYRANQDLMEQWGLDFEKPDVTGGLTVEEAAKLFREMHKVYGGVINGQAGEPVQG